MKPGVWFRLVGSNFSEAVATRFGVTCLYLLLTYKAAANLKLNHEEPGGTLIEVPAQNGEVTAGPAGRGADGRAACGA